MTEPAIFSRKALIEHPLAAATLMLAPMTYRERQAFQADLMRMGCEIPSSDRLFAALRAAIESLDPPNLAELLAVIDEYRAHSLSNEEAERTGEKPTPLPPSLQGPVDAIEAAAREVPGYAALLAARSHWLGMAPYVALSHALRGWSGLNAFGEPLPALRRANGRVPDDLLECLAEEDIRAAGWLALGLGRPSRGAEKNSAAPSPVADPPAPIAAG